MALKSYEELIKVDVRQYCEERDGFTYLNWAKCIELLRQNGATEVYWEPIPDPQTGSSLRKTDIEFKDKNNNTNRCYETRIKVVIDDGYPVILSGKSAFTTIPDTEEAENKVKNSTEYHLQPTSQVREGVDGVMYRTYRLLRGSRTYNTEEMSRLISGLITMCKEAQIPDREIATPEEKRLLKERYGVDV